MFYSDDEMTPEQAKKWGLNILEMLDEGLVTFQYDSQLREVAANLISNDDKAAIPEGVGEYLMSVGKFLKRDSLSVLGSQLASGNIIIRAALPSWGIAGDRMRFLGKNGYSSELERAKTVFVEGQEYVIAYAEIGRSSSDYVFRGIDGHWNTVMFDFADEDAIRRDIEERGDERNAILETYNQYSDFYKLS